MISFRYIANTSSKILVRLGLIFSISCGLYLTIINLDEPMDFGSFIAAGQLSKNNQNPYSYQANNVFEIKFVDEEMVIFEEEKFNILNPNLNPPISIILFEPFSKLDIISSTIVWKVFSAFTYVVILLILARRYSHHSAFIIIWSLSLAGFWQTIEVGQIYAPLWLLFTIAWIRAKDKDNIVSGILFGIIIAIKPQFGLLSIFLLIIKYKKTSIYSLLTAGLISLVPLFRFGFTIYEQWLEATAQYKGHFLPGNSSFAGLFVRISHQNIGILIGIVLILVMLYYTKTKQPDFEQTSTLAIFTILLAFPITWVGYSVFLLPWFFNQTEWNWPVKVSAAILSFPFIYILFLFMQNKYFYVIFGWFYGIAFLILLTEVLTKKKRKSSKLYLT